MGPSVPWMDTESTSEGLVWGSMVLVRFWVDGAQAWDAHRCVTQVCQLREAHEGRYTRGCPRGTPLGCSSVMAKEKWMCGVWGRGFDRDPSEVPGSGGSTWNEPLCSYPVCKVSFPQGSPETSLGPGALGRGLPGWEGCRPEGFGNALAWEWVLRGGRGAELGLHETLPGGACGTRTDPRPAWG